MEQTPILSAHETGPESGFPVLIIPGWEMNAKVEQLDFEPIFSKTVTLAPSTRTGSADNSGGLQLRRIYIDLPGMGTTPANNIQNLDDIYHHLVKFIDFRIGKSRFLLIGSSCGGYLAGAIARRYSSQVDGLLLRVPMIEPEDEKRDLDTSMPFKPLVENENLMASLSTEDKSNIGNVLIQTPDYISALKDKYEKGYLPAIQEADSDVLDPIRADTKSRYRLSSTLLDEDTIFSAPTLIVCGRQDESVGYRDSRRLLGVYPRSTYIVLDRGTHGFPVDESDRCILEALVRDWLGRGNE